VNPGLANLDSANPKADNYPAPDTAPAENPASDPAENPTSNNPTENPISNPTENPASDPTENPASDPTKKAPLLFVELRKLRKPGRGV
jgi:hypothetical protein